MVMQALPIQLAFSLFVVFLCGPVPDACLAQQDQAVVDYSVDLSDAKNHYMTITATMRPQPGSAESEVMMAVWTPGSYLVREYARNIDSMQVTDARGEALEYDKVKKNRWRIKHGDAREFVVKYRLYANEMSVRTNWVGMQYAMINGAPSFITLVDHLDRPHQVTLQLPDNWSRSASALKSAGQDHQYRADSFDELVDSPIVAGNVSVYPFQASGVEHQLVNIGESGYWDGEKAAQDLKLMVEEHHRMWGTVPYDRYLFLNMISESGGGLEHNNSTLIMTSRWAYRSESRYESWLSLASHEFFHTWNVRRLRPKTLVRYDYENEVYTRSLWIAEGITSYYQDLALVRAGLIDRKAYLKRLSGDVESVQRTAGRKKQSLADSSFDTWIKFYRPDENSSNTRISYYSKGAVAAFLLDVRIRKLTGGQGSLDDVMRLMFERYSGSGFTPEEFRSVASEVAGQDLSDWFRQTIDSTEEMDFSDLEFVGVQVPKPARESAPEKSDQDEDQTGEADADQPDDAQTESNESDGEEQDEASSEGENEDQNDNEDEEAKDQDPWIGLSAAGDGQVIVSSVKPDSPAYDAGFNTDDEVIAINGFRVSRSVDSRLSQYEVGDTIDILIARRGKLLTLPVTIAAEVRENWRLNFVKKPDEDQKQQLDLWLNALEE